MRAGLLLLVLLLSGCAAPAPSSGAAALRVAPGADAASPFVEAFTVGPDLASFHATVRAAPGGTVVIDDLARLAHAGADPSTLLVRAQVAAPEGARAWALHLVDASGATLAVVDLLADEPAARVPLAPASVVTVRLVASFDEDTAGEARADVALALEA